MEKVTEESRREQRERSMAFREAIRKLLQAAPRKVLSSDPLTSRYGVLPQALRAEINDVVEEAAREMHSPRISRLNQISYDGKVCDFRLEYEWDKFQGNLSREVFLRKGGEEEDEVAVSALLGPLVCVEAEQRGKGEEAVGGFDLEPGNVYMKVGLKKLGVRSVVLFDCEVVGDDNDDERSDFEVRRVTVLPNGAFPSDCSVCSRHLKSGDTLQLAFKDYLISMGVNTELTNYLILHLRETEKRQYADWLLTYLQTLHRMLDDCKARGTSTDCIQ